jgi:hypothetical protein
MMGTNRRFGLTLLTATSLLFTACFELEQPPGDSPLPDPTDAALTGLDVGDACVDEYAAFDGSSEVQHDGLRWLNCYRNLAGMQTVPLAEDASLATSRHVAYMIETGEYSMVETDRSAANYSGYDTLERLETAGSDVDLEFASPYEAVTRLTGGSAEPVGAIDNWINTVYHRSPLLRPLVDSVGLDFQGEYGDLITTGPWDTEDVGGGLLAARYPVSGQTGVPTTFHSDREWPDPVDGVDAVGSPVSVTFQADTWFENDNHFDVQLVPEGCALRAADGSELAVELLEPATEPYLWSTVVLVPAEPLEPWQTYVVELEATVGGAPWKARWSFSTAGE